MLSLRTGARSGSSHFFAAVLLISANASIAQSNAQESAAGQSRATTIDSARLERLVERLEAERRRMHIPGLAIAVVHNDRIVLAKGLGLADIQNKRAVTKETIFAVGSTTKAFTSTLIGMLVDDGKLAWDDAVERHLPNFRTQVDTGSNKVTLRDLLAHRSGYTRMGLLWSSGKLTRDEVLEHVAEAEPLAGFRKKFLYNNIMYMSAGHAAGLAAGSDWDAQIAKRIFGPLGMRNSSTSATVAKKDAQLAKGYLWNEDHDRFDRLPMRNLDLVGPAGSINSNVVDMAQWLRLQLGRGVYAGKRLIKTETHAETWKPQMPMGPGIAYGLGWMLRSWSGMKVVEHGGNIDGFAAQVSMLPAKRLGYVMLANVTASPLQQKSIDVVFGSLLGEAKAEAKNDFAGLTGKYVANFASFRDARFRVLVRDGRLAIDIPKQRVYELKAPDAEGKRYFALTNQVAVSFATDAKGKATSLTMHQAGMNFECRREGVEAKADVPLAKLEKIVGAYEDPDSGRLIHAIVIDKRLTLDEKSGGRFALGAPDKDGKWPMHANPARMQVRFNANKDGSIRSMTRFQRGREVEMPRVGADEVGSLPSVDALLAKVRKAYGIDKLERLGALRMSGRVRFVHQGIGGRTTQHLAGRRFAGSIHFDKVGTIRTAYDGKRAWAKTSFAPFKELLGAELRMHAYKHPLWLLGDWRADYPAAAVIGTETAAKQKVYLLRLSGKGIPDRTLAISIETSRVLIEKTAEIVRGVTSFPITYKSGDFRKVDGVLLPFRVSARSTQIGEVVVQYESAETLEAVDDEAFRLRPDAETKASK